MSTHVTARPRRGRAAAHVLGPHPGVGELGGPSSFSVGALSAQPAAPWAAVPTLTPCRDGGRLWRPAIPLWGVPGAGWLPYRSTSPPSGRTRRCLTTSVLALELKVMPVSFPHVFLHVSLSQSSNMSPRKRQCGEGRPHSGPGADRAAGGGGSLPRPGYVTLSRGTATRIPGAAACGTSCRERGRPGSCSLVPGGLTPAAVVHTAPDVPALQLRELSRTCRVTTSPRGRPMATAQSACPGPRMSMVPVGSRCCWPQVPGKTAGAWVNRASGRGTPPPQGRAGGFRVRGKPGRWGGWHPPRPHQKHA